MKNTQHNTNTGAGNMTKTAQTINGITITSTTIQNQSIQSVTLNHKTNILTVAYKNEVEHVDPADDWEWWDYLVSKYIA